MSATDRDRWDAKYAGRPLPGDIAPDAWLVEQAAPLRPGRALELACGLGRNSIWLAQQGWHVTGVDVSRVGLGLAERIAHDHGVQVEWIAADLDDFVPEAAAFELVIVFRFLDRVRLPKLIEQALRPGGRLIYETYTTQHLTRPDSHMKNPDFALAPGELPRLYAGLNVLSYAECSLADRDVARLVAEKRC